MMEDPKGLGSELGLGKSSGNFESIPPNWLSEFPVAASAVVELDKGDSAWCPGWELSISSRESTFECPSETFIPPIDPTKLPHKAQPRFVPVSNPDLKLESIPKILHQLITSLPLGNVLGNFISSRRALEGHNQGTGC